MSVCSNSAIARRIKHRPCRLLVCRHGALTERPLLRLTARSEEEPRRGRGVPVRRVIVGARTARPRRRWMRRLAPMVSRLVYLYDASPINVRDRRVLLKDQLRRVGVLDEWEVRATPSRNALLMSLYADAAQRPARTSVTLLDLRAETGDLEQVGFKVCDRITRHPSLRRATRPVIWSDVHTAANLQYARGWGRWPSSTTSGSIAGTTLPMLPKLRWWTCCGGRGHSPQNVTRMLAHRGCSQRTAVRSRRRSGTGGSGSSGGSATRPPRPRVRAALGYG